MQQQQSFRLKTFKALLQLHCRRCSATLRSLSHFFLLLPSLGLLMWPAPHFVHYFLVPLHSVTFTARHLLTQPGAAPCSQGQCCSGTQAASSSSMFIPLHFRSTTSFIHFSKAQSTRCLLLLCSPCGHRLRYGPALAQIHAHKAIALCHTLPLHCVSIAPR
jgi:hypothetical protein